MSYFKFLLKKTILHIKSILIKGNSKSDSYFYKWQRLRKLAKLYNCKTLIETGTYYGLTIDKMKPYFNEIYSIEIDKNLFKYNSLYFHGNNKIKLQFGDSKFILPKLLEVLTNEHLGNPIIFWLDGHCSENETGMGDDYSPLEFELKTILCKFEFIKSIIVIDDFRLFDGVNYPSLDRLQRIMEESKFNSYNDRDAMIYIDKRIL